MHKVIFLCTCVVAAHALAIHEDITSSTSKPDSVNTDSGNSLGATTVKNVQSTTEVLSTIVSTTSTAPTSTGTVENPCGEMKECVPYYSCNNYTKPTEGLIDIHLAMEGCDKLLDVCCLTTDIITSPTMKPDQPAKWEKCGHVNKELFDKPVRVDTSEFARFGEFPWMVAVFKWEPVNKNEPDGEKQKTFVGGGSLVHPSIVLTAAHIVGGMEMSVRAGEWDTRTESEQYPHQERSVKEAVLHKEYLKATLHHDVALLFLSSPFDPAPHISTACLVSEHERLVNGTRCWTSGWGKNNFGKEGIYSNVLKKVDVLLTDNNICQDHLRSTRLGPRFSLHSSFICAGGELNKDSCKGDGGSPLICPISGTPDRIVQQGVVSWGVGCGQDGVPGVYADITDARQWIDKEVQKREYSIRTYADYS